MAYKVQLGAAHLAGLVSGSSTIRAVGSMSSSGDIAVTGAVHAATLFGDGAGITGLTVAALSGTTAQLTTGLETSGYLKVSGSTTLAGVSGSGTAVFGSSISSSGDVAVTGAVHAAQFYGGGAGISSSGGAQVVGNTLLGGQLGISGGVKFQVTTITTNTHLTASTATTYQVVSGGTTALTVMLPSASEGENYQYAVKRHALMSGTVTITGSDIADVIDGEATLQLQTAGASVFLISDGTQWNIF